MRQLPEKLNVLSVSYPILYFDLLSEVDLCRKEELASQWDMEDDTIRIHKGGRSWKSICQSLWTMALEIICMKLDINIPSENSKESTIRRLAVGLNTVMFYIGDEKGLAEEEEGKGMKLADETEGQKEIVEKFGNNKVISRFEGKK